MKSKRIVDKKALFVNNPNDKVALLELLFQRCKENVEGRSCNNCKPGTFGLDQGWLVGWLELEFSSPDEQEGCLSCYCSGVTDECSDARCCLFD